MSECLLSSYRVCHSDGVIVRSGSRLASPLKWSLLTRCGPSALAMTEMIFLFIALLTGMTIVPCRRAFVHFLLRRRESARCGSIIGRASPLSPRGGRTRTSSQAGRVSCATRRSPRAGPKPENRGPPSSLLRPKTSRPRRLCSVISAHTLAVLTL